MTLTERQEKLLDKIVKEYINSALPISSQLLNEKYRFDISPATLLIEMQKLTDKGFLYQPHTSAGRVPTDRGYRFFVDKLFEKGFSQFDDKKGSEISQEIKKDMENSLKFTQAVSKVLASHSSNVGVGYLFGEDVFWKEGWEDILSEPEFKEVDCISRFAKMISFLERNIEDIASSFPSETAVFIGKESPVSQNKDFSIVTTRFNFPDLHCEGFFAILGPKRMKYNRNISLINFLNQSLKEF